MVPSISHDRRDLFREPLQFESACILAYIEARDPGDDPHDQQHYDQLNKGKPFP